MERKQNVFRAGALSVRDDVAPVSREGFNDYTLRLRLDLSKGMLEKTGGWACFKSARFGDRRSPDVEVPAWQVRDDSRYYLERTYLIDSGIIGISDVISGELLSSAEYLMLKLNKAYPRHFCDALIKLARHRKVDVVIDWGQEHPEYLNITIEHIDRSITRPSKLAAQIARNLSTETIRGLNAYVESLKHGHYDEGS